ncbi:hypothetical protein BC835DRAFT_1261833 [Cytidiella melzeri]|nr:hypothetical protein BC835DRAFT_1261833 [Cytidiella melzeri]
MDAATPRAQGAFPKRKKAPVPLLLIETPSQHEDISPVLAGAQQTSPTVSSATSDTDSFIFSPSSRPQSRTMNRKRLSLSLPSAQSSSTSLFSPTTSEQQKLPEDASTLYPRHRLSVVSLPNTSTSSLLHRKDEDGDDSSTVPYVDGPIQILPGIWLGNEDNARDWQGLLKRGIKSVLNVAKEVVTSFDSTYPQHGRASMSTPDLNMATSSPPSDSTFFPAHLPSGRPAMHYLRLPWSHGQSDLVSSGFPVAMSFVDQGLLRGDSVLIHCQCGVSRSATLVIALVMRASARCSPYAPEEVWAMKGNMQAAYSYVKEKSKWAGPNMSLIYQLMDYERALKAEGTSPTASDQSSTGAEDEEDWARRRQMVEDTDAEDNDRDSMEVMREAQALDKAMEYRRVARKNSTSSVSSATSTGLGMGAAWREKYGPARKRAGSIASTGSFLSEDLVEEEEEQELLGVGGGFTETSCSSAEPTEDECSSANVFVDSHSPVSGSLLSGTPKARHYLPRIPPSAPAHKTSFELPPAPATAIRAFLDVTPKAKSKARKRPPPLVDILPPVPSSPVTPVQVINPVNSTRTRSRAEGRKPDLPSTALRSSFPKSSKKPHRSAPISATPSQTLFVFPPSPTLAVSRTPSAMTLMSNSSLPFPVAITPRVSTFKTEGRRKSFIGVGAPVTPTVASSRVDARGWIELNKQH